MNNELRFLFTYNNMKSVVTSAQISLKNNNSRIARKDNDSVPYDWVINYIQKTPNGFLRNGPWILR